MPIGHQIYNFPQSIVDSDSSTNIRGDKLFYMKARVMAGQIDLSENTVVSDYQWLTRRELERHVQPRDFAAVKNLLADR